jgi:hypothetical protein
MPLPPRALAFAPLPACLPADVREGEGAAGRALLRQHARVVPKGSHRQQQQRRRRRLASSKHTTGCVLLRSWRLGRRRAGGRQPVREQCCCGSTAGVAQPGRAAGDSCGGTMALQSFVDAPGASSSCASVRVAAVLWPGQRVRARTTPSHPAWLWLCIADCATHGCCGGA